MTKISHTLAYSPADATATHCLLLQYNPDWFYLSGPADLGTPGKRAIKRVCVCVPSSMLETCDGKITVEECAAAISSMENNKTPGSDGLPKEFYSIFYLFPQGFVEMLNQSFEAGILPPSLR